MSICHWIDVKEIITDSINSAGFEGNLVSYSDETAIIQKTIIQNLYDNPVVVCDVSCKNPNVMFELGMRLAFDKPTVIIKDERTDYIFDTSLIEHLTYPRDLHFQSVVKFKTELAKKIKATYEKWENEPNESIFLGNFGKFTIAKLDEKEVSAQEFLLEEIKGIKQVLSNLQSQGKHSQNLDARELLRRHLKDQPPAYNLAYITFKFTRDMETEEKNDFMTAALDLAKTYQFDSKSVNSDGASIVLNVGQIAETHKKQYIDFERHVYALVKAIEGSLPLELINIDFL